MRLASSLLLYCKDLGLALEESKALHLAMLRVEVFVGYAILKRVQILIMILP